MRPGPALAAAFILVVLPAAALPAATSRYTDFDSRRCRHTPGRGEADGGSWLCRGLTGLPIRLSVGDERMYVSFGPAGGADDLAASETFPAFNDVYSGRVEWRLRGTRPFAAILRWNVMTAGDVQNAKGPTKPTGRVLVVTRLGPGGRCHVGYVDAVANPDANGLARQVADEKAEGFRCGSDRAVAVGRTSGLAFPSRSP